MHVVLHGYLLTRQEAAARYGVSVRTLDSLYRRHADFPVIRIGKRVLIPADAADEWFRERINGRI